MAADASIPPLIAAQLNHLLVHSSIPIKLDQSWSGGKTPRYSDRFRLLIPYCLDYIKWEVIYTASHPFAAPDIIFDEDDDDGDFNPLADGMVTTDWNASDPAALLTLVNEIREAYRLYQMHRVVELGSRFESGVNSAFAREGIEVSVIFGPNRPEEVKFAVPLLDIDLNKLVPCCPWKYPQQIYLEVVFPVSSKSPRLKLVSSSDLNALFSIEDVRLSKWSNGMSMDEYLPPLEENLKVKVATAVQSLPCRRRFIEALAPKFGRPLEADPVCPQHSSVPYCTSRSFKIVNHPAIIRSTAGKQQYFQSLGTSDFWFIFHFPLSFQSSNLSWIYKHASISILGVYQLCVKRNRVHGVLDGIRNRWSNASLIFWLMSVWTSRYTAMTLPSIGRHAMLAPQRSGEVYFILVFVNHCAIAIR